MSQPTPPQFTDAKSAKAQAKAEKAYRKAQRPFYAKKRFILLAVIIVIIAIIVISTRGGSKGTVSGSAGSASAGPSSAPAQKASSPKFGQTFTFKDGSAITITAPEPFTPSSSAAAAPGAKGFEVVTVTAKNGTAKAMNPVEVNLQGTSGGQQASQVFDSAKGISPPSADIQPGQSLTWKAVFGEAQPGDLQVQAGVGFGSGSVVFTR